MTTTITEAPRTARTTGEVEASLTPKPRRLLSPDARAVISKKASLPAAVREILERGRAIRKSGGPEGIESLVSPHEERRLEGLLPALPAPVVAAIVDVLEGAKLPIHRPLILRAVHARLGRLLRSPEAAIGELRHYALALRELDLEASKRKSTVLDLDSSKNESFFDPLGLSERRGLVHARGDGDRAGDNDGLFQRFTASCGPTVIQMLAAEQDPALALELHQAGLLDPGARGRVAAFQRRLLVRFDGVAVGNEATTLRARIHNGLGRARGSGALDDQQIASLKKHIGGDRLDAGAKAALAVLRETYSGFPTAAELALVRRSPPKLDRGIDCAAFLTALTEEVSARSGVTYRMTNPPSGFARGRAGRHLDAVARALRQGIDVPFGISEPAHWMALTAVRGSKPKREFLVSDPLGGRTAWVTEQDFLKGTFCKAPFQLSTGKQRGYVDCFFLPT